MLGSLSAAAASPIKVTKPASTEPLSVSGAADWTAAIAAKLTPLLPAGVRLRRIDLGCPTPPLGARLTQVAPGITRLNSRGFVVEFQRGNRTLACSATVDAQRQILTAARAIAQDEVISDADFQAAWTDAFGSSLDALTALPTTRPLVATIALSAGQPLLASEIARPLAIHPGDLVTVLVRNGPVTVRTQLQARSAASVGESAAVINPDSGTPVSVTVTGEKAAELVIQ